MAQIAHDVRTILSRPTIYSIFQRLMGAHQARTRFVEDWVRPYPGMKLLDIGCGPGDVLAYLPNVDYWGFDISGAYIARANRRFGGRGRFFDQPLTASNVEKLRPFDAVMAVGLLHHLDDEAATHVMRLAHMALKPGGRLLSVDPCIEPGQSAIARFLVTHDRGQNVRNKRGYAALARSAFVSPSVEVRHQRWIPYTHCLMECTRA